MKRNYVVYMLRMKNGRIYTGITNDLPKRLRAHAAGKGSRVVRSFGVDAVIYTKQCRSKSAALKREAAIKRMTREEKLRLGIRAIVRHKKSQ